MTAEIWNTLTKADQRTVLHIAHRAEHAFMIRIEVGLPWRELLPSTQDLLRDVDWRQ